MTVELLDSPRFHGFRVRRQISGKTYQEYFPLKADGVRLRGARREAVRKQAEARDAELAGEQQSARNVAARTIHVDAQGRVRGILYRLKTEKSGRRTPVFQIGIMSSRDERIVNTTVSISRHGLAEAWQRAVDFYAEHKQIHKRAKAYRDLLAARPTPARLKRVGIVLS